MSNLDRFLILEGLLAIFPHLLAICFDRNLSYYRPILMRELCSDYGAIPFRLFHSWFQMDGFDKMVEETWKNMNIVDDNGLIRLNKKLQFLKLKLRFLIKNAKTERILEKDNILNKLIEIDRLLDHGGTNTEVLNQRMELMKSLNELNSLEASEAAQKAKVRWSIKGNENTKYFHGVLNNKRSQLAISGVLEDSEWFAEPVKVKHAFFSHFANGLIKLILFVFSWILNYQKPCLWIKWKSLKGR